MLDWQIVKLYAGQASMFVKILYILWLLYQPYTSTQNNEINVESGSMLYYKAFMIVCTQSL